MICVQWEKEMINPKNEYVFINICWLVCSWKKLPRVLSVDISRLWGFRWSDLICFWITLLEYTSRTLSFIYLRYILSAVYHTPELCTYHHNPRTFSLTLGPHPYFTFCVWICVFYTFHINWNHTVYDPLNFLHLNIMFSR